MVALEQNHNHGNNEIGRVELSKLIKSKLQIRFVELFVFLFVSCFFKGLQMQCNEILGLQLCSVFFQLYVLITLLFDNQKREVLIEFKITNVAFQKKL